MTTGTKLEATAKSRRELADDAYELSRQVWAFTQCDEIRQRLPMSELAGLYELAGLLLGYVYLMILPEEDHTAFVAERLSTYEEWLDQYRTDTST